MFEELKPYGFDDYFLEKFKEAAADGLEPARVTASHRGSFGVFSRFGDLLAELAGRLVWEAAQGDLPVVGDWVVIAPRPDEAAATIHGLLPRRSEMSRGEGDRKSEVARSAPETGAKQVLIANVDTVFLVTALTRDFNLRRLERYLAAVWGGGSQPVIVLNKSDLCDDPAGYVERVADIATGVDIHVTSAVDLVGLDDLKAHASPGKTVALLGSSGVGKSSLINAMVGKQLQPTMEIREDGKGRHMTVRRELVLIPDGGSLIDTPGLRELGLWDVSESVGRIFKDIESLMGDCKFGNCSHGAEPGCAIKSAIDNGSLDAPRWENYQKLQREAAHAELKEAGRSSAAERRRKKKRVRSARKRERSGVDAFGDW